MSAGAHSEEGGGRGGPEKGQFYGFKEGVGFVRKLRGGEKGIPVRNSDRFGRGRGEFLFSFNASRRTSAWYFPCLFLGLLSPRTVFDWSATAGVHRGFVILRNSRSLSRGSFDVKREKQRLRRRLPSVLLPGSEQYLVIDCLAPVGCSEFTILRLATCSLFPFV